MSHCELPQADLCITKGDDKTFSFRYIVDGLAYDLTDYVIVLNCADPILAATAVLADQITSTGEYSFSYSASDTTQLTTIRVAYTVSFFLPSGDRETKYGGFINIS